MYQVGLIEKIENNIATVYVRRVSACGENCKTCSSNCNVNGVRVEIKSNLELNIGDFVEIQTETKHILKYAFIAYGVPLIIMIATLLLTMKILYNNSYKELISILLGLMSLILSSYILKAYDSKISKSKEIKYIISRIL